MWRSRKNDKNDIHRGKIKFLRKESIFRRTIQNQGVILHGLQYDYLSSKPYVKGELFPLPKWHNVKEIMLDELGQWTPGRGGE